MMSDGSLRGDYGCKMPGSWWRFVTLLFLTRDGNAVERFSRLGVTVDWCWLRCNVPPSDLPWPGFA